jgi:galactonate dehydratase
MAHRSVIGAIEDISRLLTGERPGLGIGINGDEIKKYPFQQEVLQQTFYKDGSVGDW